MTHRAHGQVDGWTGAGFLPRHDHASEPLDEWDCVDELVDAEAWSQELVV